MSTPAQIAANQANAKLSTGPKSTEGKAKSSLNAVSTGLTGRTVLLHGDDAKAYSGHMANFFVRFAPQTPEEEEIVQDLAQTKWRLNRVPQLEEDLWALGTISFASMFDDQATEVRPGLIRAHTFVTYGKRFDNLYLQESRLMRRYEKLLKQLGEIQFQRQAAEIDERAAARAKADRPPEHTGRLAPVVRDLVNTGFEFSNGHKVRPEESFGSLSPAEKAKVLEEVNQRLGKPGIK
ncbi:MAG TPA: hypothetical protein VHZ07_07560 [Bryobacteraceae bacterium]|jgi:hypothetical protein|nr:hypothetical protein [Bryobacteraceae bacterium]